MCKMQIYIYLLYVYTFTIYYLFNITNGQYCRTLKCNVLMIFIDDLRHLSNEIENLPNIRKMAGKGIVFKNTFAQQALCAPSRNSILTGRRPDVLRLYDFYSYWRKTVGNFTTLPQLFKDHGYSTFSVGKVFHPGKSSNFSDDYPYSWTEYPYHPSTERYKDSAVCKDQKSKTLHKNLLCPVDINSQPEKTLPDIQSLNYAIKILLDRKKKKPFFLAVGFHKPHIPFRFPATYLEKYPISKIKLPKMPYKPSKMPMVAWHLWTDVRRRDDIKKLKIPFPFGVMPSDWTRKIKQNYYAASTYIDDLIGILLNYVNMNNTIVILTSDHGWSLGENGLWAKYSNFDIALKVPLIFNIPGLQARTVYTPVESVDIFPTLVDLTGILKHKPKCKKTNMTLCFDGKSLLPFIVNIEKAKHWKRSIALSQYPRPSVYPQKTSDRPKLKDIKIMGYSIRNQRFRYTEWIGFNSSNFIRNWTDIYGVELYDHYIEEDESINLYDVPVYKDLVRHLSKQLRFKVQR